MYWEWVSKRVGIMVTMCQENKCNRKTWQLDHINALDNFNLENREEFLKAVNFSNYRPLLALDNLIKSDKPGIMS